MTTTPIDAATYAETERRLGRLLGTRKDVLLLPGEAILVLEATARGLGGPGVRALNLVSGPYGQILGDWLAVGGAEVQHLSVEFDRALDPETVGNALSRGRFDVVSVVHAEAATGVVNPLAEIADAAHLAGALVMVDAVASVGADPLEIDRLDLDLTMIGTQKAPGGPNGVCALVASERGWGRIAANPAAPRNSMLSLLDWKQRWIDAGRQQVPGYIYEHELRALLVALDGLEAEGGMAPLVERHQRAAAAVRAAARTLGLELWVADEREAAAVVTLLRPPAGVTVAEFARVVTAGLTGGDVTLLAPVPGPLGDSALRINHTGAKAQPASVLLAVSALSEGLQRLGLDSDPGSALAAAEAALSGA